MSDDKSPKPEAPEGKQYIQVQGHMFLAPAPYAEGMTINASEASALNQVFGENLRNNFAAQMKRASNEGRELPGQPEFDAYASSYEFGQRRIRIASAKDPIATTERQLATQMVKDALSAKGYKWADLDKDQREALVQRVVEKGSVRAQAEQIVAAKRQAADSLGDLGL